MAGSAARAGRLWELMVAIGGVGVLLLATALAARLPQLVSWSVVLIGSAYAVALLVRSETIDGTAPLFAVGLLLVAELAYWSVETSVPTEPGILSRRIGRLALLALVSGGIAAVVLAASELAVEGGLLLEGLGVLAAGAALALVVALARRASSVGSTE